MRPLIFFSVRSYYLQLAIGCCLTLLAATSSVIAAVQEYLPQSVVVITIDNFENGEAVHFDLPLLKGTAPDSQNIVIENNGSTTEWSVNNGRWRAFVPLQEGENNLVLMNSDGNSTTFTLNYLPVDNGKVVRLVYLLGSDSTGEFDAPAGVPNTLDDAIPRLQLAGRMMQSLMAELIAEKGASRQTFSLLRQPDLTPVVDTVISPLTVSELRSMDGIPLWFHFKELMQDLPDRNNIIDLAIIADTHFDPAINPNVPLAHTALALFPLALFGSGSIHSWPATVDSIEARFTDPRMTEPFLFPEFGRCNDCAGETSRPYWSNATTSLGAAFHELGHTFGLGHPQPEEIPNIMNRGFDYLNRAFITFEPGHGAIDPETDIMPRWSDSSLAILQSSPWIKLAPENGGQQIIDIDIKPDSFPNSVNPKNKGIIPVAILGAIDFDALQSDLSTLKFGPDEASIAHSMVHVEDVNGDGYLDLVTHFKTQETGIACGEIEATLTGYTFDGQGLTGTDSVEVVGCPKKNTIHIEALIDGKSQLILSGNTLQWHHLDYAAPGRHGFREEPTIVNDATWFPIWPNVPNEENRFCDCFSDAFKSVKLTQLKTAESVDVDLIQSRGETEIVQYPSKQNGYTLILEFDDNAIGGSDNYIVEVYFSND